jgi:hypothetical protein
MRRQLFVSAEILAAAHLADLYRLLDDLASYLFLEAH